MIWLRGEDLISARFWPARLPRLSAVRRDKSCPHPNDPLEHFSHTLMHKRRILKPHHGQIFRIISAAAFTSDQLLNQNRPQMFERFDVDTIRTVLFEGGEMLDLPSQIEQRK
jgi:hypothetical protein